MRKELAERLNASPRAQEAWILFELWRRLCRPKAREFGTKRMKAVIERLGGGYSAGDIAVGIVGAAVFAYRSPDGIVHDDLETICETPKKLDLFIKRGHKALTGDLESDQAPPLYTRLVDRMGQQGQREFFDVLELLKKVPGYGPEAGELH